MMSLCCVFLSDGVKGTKVLISPMIGDTKQQICMVFGKNHHPNLLFCVCVIKC